MSAWPMFRLGECAEIVSGATPSTSEPSYWGGDISWATPKDLSELDGIYIAATPRKITDHGLQSCAAAVLPPESVLFSSRAPIGHVAINTMPMATNQGFKSFIPNRDRLDAKYLYYWLRANRQYLESLGNGATFKEVSKAVVSRIEIPLPPLPEQQRIAAVLDKADALRAKRRAALEKLNELTQSIFLDMFGDPATNPKGWPECTFGDMFEICSSKRVHERDWKQKGVPFYRAREIVKLAKDGYVNSDLFISEELFKQLSSNGSAPQPGDLMISAVGTLGACYEVRPKHRFYFKDASVLRFIPKNGVVPSFIRCAFSTSHVVRQIQSGSGSTVGTYTIARARETRIYAPPVALQRRFARVLECLESQARTQLEGARQFDILFASLQCRVFRGDL